MGDNPGGANQWDCFSGFHSRHRSCCSVVSRCHFGAAQVIAVQNYCWISVCSTWCTGFVVLWENLQSSPYLGRVSPTTLPAALMSPLGAVQALSHTFLFNLQSRTVITVSGGKKSKMGFKRPVHNLTGYSDVEMGFTVANKGWQHDREATGISLAWRISQVETNLADF